MEERIELLNLFFLRHLSSLAIPMIVIAVTVVPVLVTRERVITLGTAVVTMVMHPTHVLIFVIATLFIAGVSASVVATTVVSIRVGARVVCIDIRESSQK
jgi:hypothetical protein